MKQAAVAMDNQEEKVSKHVALYGDLLELLTIQTPQD